MCDVRLEYSSLAGEIFNGTRLGAAEKRLVNTHMAHIISCVMALTE
jgi:hypothetical protein